MSLPYRRLLSLVVFVAALAFLVLSPAGAQEDVASQVLARINQARAEAGLPPLTRHPLLDAAAQGQADDMAQHGSQLGHRGSDGSTYRQRIARAGYASDMVGENWAGYRSLDKVFGFWLNDPPHRRNILRNKYTEVGIGIGVRPNGSLIIVTDFGGGMVAMPESVAPPPQPQLAIEAQPVPTEVPPEPTQPPPAPPTEAPPPPPEPTPEPTLPPPPPPPTLVPTLAPTPLPSPTVVALALVPPPPPVLPLSGQVQVQRLRAEGIASGKQSVPLVTGDYRRILMGVTLSIGSVMLLGISMVGHKQHTNFLRKKE